MSDVILKQRMKRYIWSLDQLSLRVVFGFYSCYCFNTPQHLMD